MSRYKQYDVLKHSNIAWLGQIPENWQLKRFKNIFKIQKRISGELGYQILSITQRGIKVKDIESGDGQLSMDYSKYQLVYKNDFAMNHMDLLTGFVDISNFDGVTSPDYRVFTMFEKNSHDRYFLYLLQLCYIAKIFYPLGQGAATVGRWRLPTEAFTEFLAPLPNLQEQKAIANFLDHETAKIDTLIAKQQELIKLLKEKRQAVISHAVTKGLNPNAPMRDSGVEWLGDVPAHWGIKRFKFLCDQIIAGPFGSSITKDMYVKEGFKVYGQEQVIPNDFSIGDYYISERDYLELSRYVVKAGDILISCVGTFGKVAVFPVDGEPGIINPRLIKAEVNKKFDPHYLREFLKSEMVFKQFELLSRGGTMGVINIAILNEIIASAPPISEQKEIFNYIKEQENKFNHLIACANQQIELSQERRTALISAAVTGKIDVRDWQPPVSEAQAA